MTHTVYSITTAAGDTYIGCTSNFDKRKVRHANLGRLKRPNFRVSRAIKACDGEFEMAALRTGTKSEMLRLEERAIGILKPTLNVMIGRKHSEETRQLRKGYKRSKELRIKQSELMKGNQYAKGNKLTSGTKARMSAGQKARRVREQAERSAPTPKLKRG
jgi:hypothetical protein